MKYRWYWVASLCFAICLGGCSSPSTSTVNPGSNAVSPGVGSSFTYNLVGMDTLHAIVSDNFLRGDTVLAVGLTMFGKTNVTQFTPNGFYEFVNYEPNGDISYFHKMTSQDDSSRWITVPLASEGQTFSPNADTDLSINYTFLNTSSKLVDTSMYYAVSLRRSARSASSGEGPSTEWYDMKARVLIEWDFDAWQARSGSFVDPYQIRIKSYNLKQQ